jgi:hypothetical protein
MVLFPLKLGKGDKTKPKETPSSGTLFSVYLHLKIQRPRLLRWTPKIGMGTPIRASGGLA